jgi:predicted nuclease of restriction endonuclease-like (RecB) superfamily
MNENNNTNLNEATIIIKEAIIRSRYQAAVLVNKELLSLYYGVGKYVSDNSRSGYWGKRAIKSISENLQRELPGLRGFSDTSMRTMRLFYEAWQPIFTNAANHQLSTDDLIDKRTNNEIFSNHQLLTDDLSSTATITNRPLPMGEMQIVENTANFIDLSLLLRHLHNSAVADTIGNDFLQVGFTHHTEILAKEKSQEGRFFYISRCASAFWTVEILKSYLRSNLYAKEGSLPNNFMQTLTESEQANRALRAFKDEYFLDFINIEDEIDPDERLIGNAIVANIKNLILSFGNKFCFMGRNYRVIVEEHEFFVDLLFFNRELRCLVAVELKRGSFSPAHLGQLNFYLSALDEYIKQADEAPSIGILLCKEANRGIVEFAVRDYTKPMGVATYRTRDEMPLDLQKALPDLEEMRKLLETTTEEQEII